MAKPKPQPIINGTTNPILTATHETYDPQHGIVRTEEWESAGDNLDGTAKTFRDARIGYQYTYNGRRSKLTTNATSAKQEEFNQITTDTWQLLATEVARDIKHHPKVQQFTKAQLQDVLQAVEDFQSGGEPDISGFSEDQTRVYTHIVFGFTSYIATEYVMRHTTSVANVFEENVADEGVGSVYSFANLESEITNQQLWTFPCPPRLLQKMDELENAFLAGESIPEGFTMGWRKTASTETTAANSRIDISTEYQLGLWSTFLYPQPDFF